MNAPIARLTARTLTQVFSDWNEMLGIEIELQRTVAMRVDGAAAVQRAVADGALLVETRIEGVCAGPLFMAFPLPLAAQVVGRMLMLPAEAVDEKAAAGLNAGEIEAFHEMANLLCGSSNNVLQSLRGKLRVSQDVTHLRTCVATPEALAERLPSGPLMLVKALARLGDQRFPVVQAFPASMARVIAALAPADEAA